MVSAKETPEISGTEDRVRNTGRTSMSLSRAVEKQRKLERLHNTQRVVVRRLGIIHKVWKADGAYKAGELRKKNLTCSRAGCVICSKWNAYGRKGLSKRQRIELMHHSDA